MSCSLIAKLRLGNSSERYGYYKKESKEKSARVPNQMEAGLFWILYKKSEERHPWWVPVMHHEYREGPLFYLICSMKRSGRIDSS